MGNFVNTRKHFMVGNATAPTKFLGLCSKHCHSVKTVSHTVITVSMQLKAACKAHATHTTNKCNNYHMTERTHVTKCPC